MFNRNVIRYKLLDTTTAISGVSLNARVTDFANITVKISVTSQATSGVTIKCQGAITSEATLDTPPTFSSASSATNHWSYIQMIDLADQSTVAGATGIVIGASTSSFRLFKVNANALDFLSFELSGLSGTNAVTIEVLLADNI